MRLISFRNEGRLVPSMLLDDESVVTLEAVGGPATMESLLDGGLDAARELETMATAGLIRRPLADLELGPPVPSPRNIVCVGKNYPLHAAEEGEDVPPSPLLFGKHSSTVRGPVDAIEWDPSYTEQVDYEVELAVVIGSHARHVSEDDALSHVFGYMAANDVSARDIQFGDGQWLRGKSLESFLPTGPVLVTADEIDDPQNLELSLRVNGVIKQQSNTSKMYYSIREVISFASRAFTLVPGDVILTGTPAGVGVFRDPPEFLTDGDIVEAEVESVGVLRNQCVARSVE